MNKFSRFIELSRLEKQLLFQAVLLLPLTAVAIRIFGFRRVYSFLVQRASPLFEHKQGGELFEGLGGGGMARSPLLRGVASGSLPGYVPVQPMNPTSKTKGKAVSIARAVKLAANHGPYRANCLKQSLVIWWLLQRHGVESTLRIGVRKNAAVLEAHAWVECLGQPLNDVPDIHQRFSPFAPMPSQEVNWI